MTKYRVRQIDDFKFVAEHRFWFIWLSCWYDWSGACASYTNMEDAQRACQRHWFENTHKKRNGYPKTIWSMKQ